VIGKKTAPWNQPLKAKWILLRAGAGISILVAMRIAHWLAVTLVVLFFLFAVAYRFKRRDTDVQD
jgi:hypothetical protein